MKQEIIAGIILGIIGLVLLIVKADSLWRVTEKRKSRNADGPSKNYVILIRTLGIVFAAAGVCLAVFG